MRMELAIDELVLHGFDPRDRHRVADALKRQIASDMTRGMVDLRAGVRTPRSETLVVDVEPITAVGIRSEIVGSRAGSAIATALGRAISATSREPGAG
jgi:hypothetical protein